MLAATLDGGIAAVVYNLYLLRLGYGPQLVGTINAVGMAVFAIACVPIGRLSGQVGLRRILRSGMVMIFVGSIVVPLVGWMPEFAQTPVLMVGAVVSNLGLACYFVCSAPYLGALTSAHQRTRMFSAQSAIFSIFGFAGSLLGGNIPPALAALGLGEISQPGPYQLTLWLVPGLLIIPLVLLARMRNVDADRAALEVPPTITPRAAAVDIAPMQSAVALIAFFAVIKFLQVGGVGSVQTFFNVYMDRELHVNTATIGAIQAFAKLSGVPAALAIPWLSRRVGNAGAVVGALLVAALGMLPLALIPLGWAAAVGYILVWLSTPVRYTAFMVYIMSRTPTRLHATLNGTQEGMAGLSFATIALIGGFAIQSYGYAPLFSAGAAAMFLGAALLAAYALRSRRNLILKTT